MRRATLLGLASALGSTVAAAALYGSYRRDIAEIGAEVEAGGEFVRTDCGLIQFGREGLRLRKRSRHDLKADQA